MNYVLISPARNEAALIGKTLESVVGQTLLPTRWVIVDDGSSDDTAAIVEGYARRFDWIELVRRPRDMERSFAGKVHAFNAGYERVRSLEFEVLGNLDADISFEPGYLQALMRHFEEDARLGVAGTPFIENGYDSARDSFEGVNHVAGGCQMFRRKCFAEIGGYVPNREGGIDWIAVTTARMMGWRTRSFPEHRFQHYRPMGTAERSKVAASFSYGEKDYYLGGSPIWELFRVVFRMSKRPFIIEGLALFTGYSWAALRRVKRPVSPQLIRFHRREQMTKLKTILRSIVTLRKVDNFNVGVSRPQPR
jgi:glycosyltransferase involved in cell wall biosynthesis